MFVQAVSNLADVPAAVAAVDDRIREAMLEDE